MDGTINGQGITTYASGDKYVGEYKDFKQNGQGTLTYANGSKYVGDWKDDKQNGQGIFTYGPDSEWAGTKYEGEWMDGKINGQGITTYGPNSERAGEKYVGQQKNGKNSGQGTYFFANGSKWVGEWENDDLNGYAITYKTDGSIDQEGVFKDSVFQYAQKKSNLEKSKDFCKEIGLTLKTEKFGNCVLKLMDEARRRQRTLKN